tara:strand:+ start:5556 stop:5867 length:312 start_codon:yes stop_codon:yes gene_type:complete
MKRLIVIYNIVFFILGNILISNAHYLLHHNHSQSHHHDHDDNQSNEGYECEDCLIFEKNSESYDIFKELDFSNYILNRFINFIFETLLCFDPPSFSSRAPPIN